MVKNLPAMQETWVQSLGQKDPLEKGMVTHSSILAWRIPGTEDSGGLQSMGLQRVRRDWVTNTFTFRIITAVLRPGQVLFLRVLQLLRGCRTQCSKWWALISDSLDWIQALLLTSYVAFRKLLNFSVSIPHISHGITLNFLYIIIGVR